MAISQIISRLQRNTLMQSARMRQLERRLKEKPDKYMQMELDSLDSDEMWMNYLSFN